MATGSASDTVISGIGMVTPLGATAAESVAAWDAGLVAPRKSAVELGGTSLEAAEMADLPQIDVTHRLPGRRMLKYMSEAAVLGSLAAHEAVEGAALTERFRPDRIGLFAATGLAAADLSDTLPMIAASIDQTGSFSPRLFGERGLSATNPLISFRILANMPACLVSIIEGIRGPNYIFTPWEGQTGAALVEAWRAVASGEVDAALAGAADSAAQPSTFVFLRQAGLLGEGEFPASGAAYLVFERAETVQRDGRTSHGRVAEMSLSYCHGPPHDPLAPRIGRSFAAAPAILLGLAAFPRALSRGCRIEGAISGVDKQEFRFVLDAGPQ